jgi:hypothetical protein
VHLAIHARRAAAVAVDSVFENIEAEAITRVGLVGRCLLQQCRIEQLAALKGVGEEKKM